MSDILMEITDVLLILQRLYEISERELLNLYYLDQNKYPERQDLIYSLPQDIVREKKFFWKLKQHKQEIAELSEPIRWNDICQPK
jgi:hypothetical protein